MLEKMLQFAIVLDTENIEHNDISKANIFVEKSKSTVQPKFKFAPSRTQWRGGGPSRGRTSSKCAST